MSLRMDARVVEMSRNFETSKTLSGWPLTPTAVEMTTQVLLTSNIYFQDCNILCTSYKTNFMSVWIGKSMIDLHRN